MFDTTHVDRVIASLVANPALWAAVCRGDYHDQPEYNRNLDAWIKMHELANSVNDGITLQGLRDKLVGKADRGGDAWDAADDAVIALVAYPECAYMLDSDLKELAIIAALGDDRAFMLLPACQVFAKEKECASTLTV